MEHTDLSRNTLSFLGLAAEYCSALENALHTDKDEFTSLMLKLLPRLYITMSDTDPAMLEEQNEPLATYLEPEQYDSIRHGVAVLMGEDDTYLETFEQDMKYSDTPIAATISESLADIYQPLQGQNLPRRLWPNVAKVLANTGHRHCATCSALSTHYIIIYKTPP